MQQYVNNAEKTRNAILNIVPHIFGEHNLCGTWCTFRTNPNHLQISPIEKSLTGADLRSAVEKVFFKQAENASRLCFDASSNGSESFNIMVASTARKSYHYSKSESFVFRLAATVCQKNASENYMQIANEAVGLSPGKVRSSGCQRGKIFMKNAKYRVLV